jgi:hypothetical protein
MPSRQAVSLNLIRVQTPCPASWDAMRGDERVRFCDECKLHVYNLSELSRSQAESLVAEHEGRLCVRYYQRADGTILTQDCGRIRRAMRRTRRFVVAASSAVLCALLAPLGYGSSAPPRLEVQGNPQSTDNAPPLMGDIAPPIAVQGGIQAPPPQPLMGVVAPNPPATQPTTQPANPPATQPAS